MIKAATVRGIPVMEIDRGDTLIVDRLDLEAGLNASYQKGLDAARVAEQPRRMLSAKQISEIMAISPKKASELLRTGEIASFRLDGNVRCWVDDLERYMARKAAEGEIVPDRLEVFLERYGSTPHPSPLP